MSLISGLTRAVVTQLRKDPQPSPGPAPTAPPKKNVDSFEARRKTHDELLKEYTVGKDTMTQWPKVFGLSTPKSREMTSREAAMLDDLGWIRALEVKDLGEHADSTAKERFPAQTNSNGHGDAFRHAYVNALLTHERGEEWTAAFMTAHEGNPDSSPLAVAMDLHNNEVGRRIARENPNASKEELANLVEKAVADGEMVVIGPDLKLHYSDQLPRDTAAPKNEQLPKGERRPGKEVEAPYTV